MRIIAKGSWTVLAITLALNSTAFAQTADPNKACTDQERSNPALNQQRDRRDAVICPPDIDPAIKKPPPDDTGKMPVIPPPGSPGGDPNVQPK